MIQVMRDCMVLTQYPVVCVRVSDKHYPYVFLSSLVHVLQRTTALQIIDVQAVDWARVRACLETQFLGNRTAYWLGDITAVEQKRRNEFIDYLSTYTGPHTIIFAVSSGVTMRARKEMLTLTVPEEVDKNFFIELMKIVHTFDESVASYYAGKLYARYGTMLPIDDVTMVGAYLSLIGIPQYDLFARTWIDDIIKPKSSLFNLSKLFFSKDARPFFQMWQKIYPIYSNQFWTVFWADQIWAAAFFVQSMRKNQRTTVKDITYRLPFTFLQKDWQLYSVRELKHSHDYITNTDYALKNGASALGLDLFFSKFFDGQFAQLLPSKG